MDRKLVTIQAIKELIPIKGADFVEQAIFQDIAWSCVVRKGWFDGPGDLAVFFEVDSLLPSNPIWDDLVAKYNYRIKTQKFKGVLSQGFAIPLSMVIDSGSLPGELISLSQEIEYILPYEVGDGLAEALGVTKYEPPVKNHGLAGMPRGNFPWYVRKTDETRVQSVPDVLDELRDKPYFITMKMDGSSFTCFWHEDEFHVCSRNMDLKDTEENLFWRAAKKLGLQEKLVDQTGLALQGELVGPGIQGNKLGLSDIDIYFFNIFDIHHQEYIDYDTFKNYIEDLGLQTVPIIEEGLYFTDRLPELLKKAEGYYPGTTNHREGIVIRPQVETYSEVLKGRLSFKVINNSYLLVEE